MLLEDLPTPCLLIERRRLMQNLDRMQAHATAQAVALRPHVKTHKSIHIAREQVARGAQGLTLAKPSEAAVFAEAGFCNLRIAYPVVGPTAHEQLLGLKAQVSFCVDTTEGLHAAAPVYAAHDRTADVLLEVDTGYGRTGVPWDHADLVALARLVEETPGVRLVGLLTHAGQSYDGPQAGETAEAALQRVAHEERDRLLEAAQRLHEAGVAAAQPGAFELSLGATPSIYHLENRSYAGFRITEIRPGTYVFMDGTQVGLGAATWQDCALTVMATVVSKRRDATGSERFYVDAGKKILTSDRRAGADGFGTLLYNPAAMVPMPHARLVKLSEEHGWGQVLGGATLAVGDRVRIVPNHACVTVHTRSTCYLVDGEEVQASLSVDARDAVT